MPSTAEGLGTSTEALSKMSRAQQMSYVYQYLKNAGVKSGMGMSDLYMSVLFPAAVGKPDDFVLFGRGAMSVTLVEPIHRMLVLIEMVI